MLQDDDEFHEMAAPKATAAKKGKAKTASETYVKVSTALQSIDPHG